MKLIKIKQRSKEWLEWRSDKVCASDVPILMGISPYKKIDSLWREKIKCYESPPTPYMQRGIDLEPLALQKFEEETGLIMFPRVATHDNIEWAAASFDGMTLEQDAILEIKCNGKKNHDLALEGKIPPHFNAQIQHQIFVSGLDFAFYFSFTGTEGIIIEVKRDQEFIEKMLEEELKFWHCLQTLTPPIQKNNKIKHSTKHETVTTI